jgi:hypothetical protein
LKRFASPSVKLFISSHPNSAHATWQTQDMDEPKFITLYVARPKRFELLTPKIRSLVLMRQRIAWA